MVKGERERGMLSLRGAGTQQAEAADIPKRKQPRGAHAAMQAACIPRRCSLWRELVCAGAPFDGAQADGDGGKSCGRSNERGGDCWQ